MAIFLLFTPQKNLWGPSRRHLRVVGGSFWPPQNLYKEPQLIGWRNYVMVVYVRHGSRMRDMNYLGHENPIPKSFWQARTHIPPVDDVIKKVMKWGYAHHIERLMVLGNFLLLCQCHPKHIYQWFMTMVAIDAYDIFMIP